MSTMPGINLEKIYLSDSYYHVYSRGTNQDIIFRDDEDYAVFLNLFKRYLSDSPVQDQQGREYLWLHDQIELLAYCLMPNHFHILVTPLVDGGVSKFMQRLQTAYTMYFNKKHKRSGSLFGGTYKAQHVDKDEYLKYLFSYIHLNPAKLFDSRWKEEGAKNLKKLKRQVMEYPYSSIYDYISSNFTIINPRYFPNYFEKSADFESQILFWLSFKDKKK